MKDHYVYIGFDDSKLTKVGRSSDLDRRMGAYSTTNPSYTVAAVARMPSLEAARFVEKTAHILLAPRRAIGEWFHVSVTVAVEVVEKTSDLWNMAMDFRRQIAGWGDYKFRISPMVKWPVELRDTALAPTQDQIDLEALRCALDFLGNDRPKKELVAILENEMPHHEFTAAMQWMSDFTRAHTESKTND